MFKEYRELNLAKIREEVGLDFAHFTYVNGYCSCCYGPTYFPLRYWSGKTLAEKEANRLRAEKTGECEFILFKNASNGCGQVTKYDRICVERPSRNDFSRAKICTTHIEWNMPKEKLNKVCKMLQEQLGTDYKVIKPRSIYTCIEIEYIGETENF